MTLRDLLASLRKHLLTVVLTALVVTGAVGAASMMSAPVFRASSSLYFTLDVGSSASDINQGSTYTQNQMLSFAQLATLPVVLDPVIDRLGLDLTTQELGRSVTVSRPQDTAILDIAVTGGSPAWVAQVANEVATELARTVEDVAPRDEAGDSTVTVRMVKEAQPPQFQIAPNSKRNVAVGLVAGLLLGMLVAYLRDILDTRVRRREDVAKVADVPVLAEIARFARRTSVPPLLGSANGPVAEDFRRLRTNLRFLNVDGEGLCLVLSSAVQGEGKTTTAVNLALALAEADMSVLLVDADLRRPRVAEYTGLEGAAGLTTVLIGRATPEDVIQQWSGISVLTAGELPPNPAELVATRALRAMLDDLRTRYDVVILDAPPLLPVADAAILSRTASGVVVVGDTRRLRRAQLREVVEAVDKAGGHVLGVVLNKVGGRKPRAYRYESRESAAHPHMRQRSRGARGSASHPVEALRPAAPEPVVDHVPEVTPVADVVPAPETVRRTDVPTPARDADSGRHDAGTPTGAGSTGADGRGAASLDEEVEGATAGRSLPAAPDADGSDAAVGTRRPAPAVQGAEDAPDAAVDAELVTAPERSRP